MMTIKMTAGMVVYAAYIATQEAEAGRRVPW